MGRRRQSVALNKREPNYMAGSNQSKAGSLRTYLFISPSISPIIGRIFHAFTLCSPNVKSFYCFFVRPNVLGVSNPEFRMMCPMNNLVISYLHARRSKEGIDTALYYHFDSLDIWFYLIFFSMKVNKLHIISSICIILLHSPILPKKGKNQN